MMKKHKNWNLPAWFPYPSSWLKAGLLAWFLTAIAFIIAPMAIGDSYLTNFAENRELLVVFTLAILLLPVPAIALAHHLLNLFFQIILPTLARAYSAIKKISVPQSKSTLKSEQKPRFNNRNISIFPTLINWWAGLYSWLVFVLSTIIAVTIYTLLLSGFGLSYETMSFRYKHPWEIDSLDLLYLWISFGSIWITAAASLYQIEHLFKLKISDCQRILNTSNKTEGEDIDWEEVPIIVELNQRKKRGKGGRKTSSIDIHIKLPEAQVLSQPKARKKANVSLLDRRKTKSSNWKGWQAVLGLLIIAVLVGGIYGVYLKQNTQEAAIVAQNSPPIDSEIIDNHNTLEKERSPASQNPVLSPSPSQTAILQPPDPFKMAVNRATNAAEMTQQANTRIEWEAVASQWQDAVELMKVVPAFHPNYRTAREKAIEYQDNANYARRVAANTPE